ncbi:4,5-dihydroxyphthalate decarboxylase [Mycolicibacterium madagascariense]|uniref:4,5-dihydroxyphthalate decarboxylase n=1 Tax=Mycolicibacterium madagascariense TaxID=212765 RepID=A0A7I7XCV7_9MYCO|nr:4,5-dihydroxyphthalate decarboxylase [Mycolicibacterium madagascariense]MCV7015295.1 4,5-dihydroxyphthalate decarboxylase [Mycolicibacterium madagascariense]BBZ27589.1 4,5-dihydroxyphthalate decarboxylase [Mycolicibacterium madagascariense]
MNHTLDIAFWDYDRTQALVDGSVQIDGVDARFHGGRIVTDVFEAMIRDRAYDVSELGMTYFLRLMEVDDPPFLAIPVFPVRAFRHSAIFVNAHNGIRRPQDLAGKTVGELAVYGHDAGIMAKGILSDEFGLTPDQCRWVVGGIDFPLNPIDFVATPHPAEVDVRQAGPDEDLGRMLESGAIDALMSADVPECVLRGSPHVRRLFEDYDDVEREYHRRTGIFPIMHAVVVRRELAVDHPDVVRAVYRGFCSAKDAAAERLIRGMTFNNMQTMIPWLSKLLADDRRALGQDWWPYGIAANRAALQAILRYHHEQGITTREFAVEDVFVDCLADT